MFIRGEVQAFKICALYLAVARFMIISKTWLCVNQMHSPVKVSLKQERIHSHSMKAFGLCSSKTRARMGCESPNFVLIDLANWKALYNV